MKSTNTTSSRYNLNMEVEVNRRVQRTLIDNINGTSHSARCCECQVEWGKGRGRNSVRGEKGKREGGEMAR